MGYRRFQICSVIVEYGLFNITNFIQNFLYILIWYNFDTVLYQLLGTGTSDRCLICIIQNLRFSGFRRYPLSVFLYSPFNYQLKFSIFCILSDLDPYSGNPLLDFYGQYAAAAAAAASGFTQVSQAQFPTVTQTMVPSIQSNGIDSHNAAALAAGQCTLFVYFWSASVASCKNRYS